MTKIVMALVAIAIALTGCSGETKNKPTETVTVTASPEPTESSDEAFAEVVRDGTETYSLSPTEDIVELAETICDAFDAGMAFEDIGFTLIDAGARPYDAGFVIGASVAYACPEYEDALGAYPNA